ncbi:UvrD-helicase domain-containing protein [Streptomyces monomycini]|uniref:UvrD-helicase domain-containing protein n=1 Tax=Streptomyces monomycini TaxID=371720 RepID=UPI00067B3016|nr:ATP-dependent DNA helicase [Streptomyces monomycini]
MSARITDPEQLKELLGIPFTPEQTACITAPPAPQVVVAGAGSGKTTVMAARVVWLVGTGQVAPEQVLGLTFTNKAAGELAERVRKALAAAGVTEPADPFGAGLPGAGGTGPGAPAASDGVPGEPRISTYHSFAGQLLKDHGLRIGLEPSARLLADATRFQLAARVLRTAPGPYPALTKSLPALVEDLLALDGELAEHLVEPDRLRAYDTELLTALDQVRLSNADLRKVPETARGRLELLELVRTYRAEKRRRELLDFGDQIALSATLATTRPEVGALLREEFKVVLLDEYQDTSVAQRIMLSGLFGGGTGHAVTAVGDPCQAIYGWRGASVANLDDFPDHFPYEDGSPAARSALSQNRRSGGRLLDLANGLAAPLRAMHAGVEALRPAPGAERDGVVRCALLPTHAEEMTWLAENIAHLVRTGTPPGEIAVLCRTAGDFARIQGELVAREIPVEVVGLSGLLHLPEIADLVAVCEVLQDPTANAALVRLLIGPRWQIGPRDLALLGRRARLLVHRDGQSEDPERRLAEAVEGVDPAETISLADALDTFLESDGRPDDGLPFSPEARVRFAYVARELRELRRSAGDPLMDALHRVLTVTGLEVELSASPRALAARRRETLGTFLDIAAGFAAKQGGAALDGDATLLAFLGFLRTAVQHEKGLDSSLPGGDNTVKVLTAHKSKGLEWDVVAVPGLVGKQFPSEQARDSWLTQPKVLPHALRGDAATLPDVADWSSRGLKSFKEAMKDHQSVEELRLGYVTFTRPRSLLLGSGHWWGPDQKRPRGPSAFLEALRAHCEAGHGEIEEWADAPEEGAENPSLKEAETEREWPLPLDAVAKQRRRAAAATVRAYLDGMPGGGAGTGVGTGPGVGTGADPSAGAVLPHAAAATDGPEAAATHDAPHPAAGGAASVPGRYEDSPYADVPYEGDPYEGDPYEGDPYEGAPYEDAHAADAAQGPGFAPAPAPYSAPDPDPGPEHHLADWDAWSAERPAHPEDDERPGRAVGDAVPAAAGLAHVPAQAHAPEAAPEPGPNPLLPEERRTVASWDRDLDALADELRRSRATVRDVPLPSSLSASQLLWLASDPDGFTRELARPMPHPPRPAARRGTRFHAWVESRFEELTLPLLGPDELPGGAYGHEARAQEAAGEADPIRDEDDLEALKDAFARTPYARRTPYRIEVPVQVTLAGRVIRGRIDAVYRNRGPQGDTYEIIDWKTHHAQTADPLQLALYRVAWAEQHGLPLSAVDAAFLYVRSGETVRPQRLPDRAGLERILLGEPARTAGDADATTDMEDTAGGEQR